MKTRDRNWLMFEYQGKQRNLTEIARMVGVLPVTMHARIKRGKTLEQALAMPARVRRATQ